MLKTLENTEPGNGDQRLGAYLAMLPALAWRIDIVANEITYLNAYTIPSLGEEAKAVLQNPAYARQMIVGQDNDRFLHCYDQMRNRHPAACTFRIRLADGTIAWFKLMSMPDPELPTCSLGLFMDITAHVNAILSTDGRPPLCDRIDLLDEPVLLIRFSDRRVFMANAAARSLLCYSASDMASLDLGRLFQKNTREQMFHVYEGLIFSDFWAGELIVTDSTGRHHQCMARVQAVARDEKSLLWVTLTHLNTCTACRETPTRCDAPTPPRKTIQAMAKCKTITELLKTMLDVLPPDSPTSGIMLSRIFIAENRVQVTGVGEPFDFLPEDHTHPYEGSIAENIVRFNLPQHVVQETSKSIKPIDWALFIPRGIRSYYAQPFFDNGVLTKVLIFCSRQAESYDPEAPAPLYELYPEFLKGLERCLKRKGAR
ncbi:hypothetical protein SAMN04488503_0986 [Humidesulfovibrio mexicanus]|uniref:PAS domain-containing protein n=1 Tax=Humidesulfovibrio mexicanus TaxID=147047 RepID=A0A238YVG1_9BACT|nr:PAS domain-containing protein [Humidesulfovibrio mexicanus]SNR74449.1 hypothetical protein SAMN04488503_0986 [Humidesulfovibrio mexicanus]